VCNEYTFLLFTALYRTIIIIVSVDCIVTTFYANFINQIVFSHIVDFFFFLERSEKNTCDCIDIREPKNSTVIGIASEKRVRIFMMTIQ
jgi:hypothetical protein